MPKRPVKKPVPKKKARPKAKPKKVYTEAELEKLYGKLDTIIKADKVEGGYVVTTRRKKNLNITGSPRFVHHEAATLLELNGKLYFTTTDFL